MAINFNELPDTPPSTLLEKNRYKMLIKNATMKNAKNPERPPYLSVMFEVFNAQNQKIGTLFDILTEPTADLTKFKLKRFIQALGLQLTTFELKDLAKIIVNKTLYADITIQTDPSEKYPPKNIIDVFSGDIYYSEAEANKGNIDNYMPEDLSTETPFDADDAEDAGTPTPAEEVIY